MAIDAVLLDAGGWTQLRAELAIGQQNLTIVDNIIRHLHELDAQTYFIEDEYLDRDFTEAFAAYYAKLFKRHSKLCRRVHFFKSDLSDVVVAETASEMARLLEERQPDYLGFIVLRPIHQAPIAQATLATPPALPGYESHALVKAEYHTHILGASLSVHGLPMTQQDSRIGACAQATIWSAARHFHARHKTPWISTVGITEAALRGEFATVSSMLPNGSESLSINGMVSALRACGRHPLLYSAASLQKPFQWNAIRPVDIINRYVDSGIPVILALKSDEGIGHAVIASGQIFTGEAPTLPLPDRPTRAEFCSAFYVNDDQRGPNLRVAIREDDPIGETEYSIDSDLWALIIPLPDKVFLPAEKAEALAWDLMDFYAGAWPGLRAGNADELGSSVAAGDAFLAQLADNTVLARTYLTYGWKYKHRIIRNRVVEAVKGLARGTELPKYVWVTEFGTVESFGRQDQAARRIFAHCVVDATAKNMGEDSRLFFHAPGFAVRRVHDPDNPNGDYRSQHRVIQNDQDYFPKRRGVHGFE